MKVILIVFLNLLLISNVFGETKTKITDQCVEGDCVNGWGKRVDADGAIYEGQWKDYMLMGQGKMTDRPGRYNGGVYEGEIKKNRRHGQGKMTYYNNGFIYIGKWKNHFLNGQGKIIYPFGGFAEGNFKNSKFDGKIKFTDANGKITYKNYKNSNRVKKVAEIDPKKYWEGALNCYRYTDNPIKKGQRPYIDQLTLTVENYKRNKNKMDANMIIRYSKDIVERLGCSKDLFK